jgi:hypothetical protein
VVTGRGKRSTRRGHGITRNTALRFLQALLPVRLANNNEGLVIARRQEVLKLMHVVQKDGKTFDPVTFSWALVSPTSARTRVSSFQESQEKAGLCYLPNS